MIGHLLRVARGALRERKKAKRSPEWATARRHWLKVNGFCASCYSMNRLQVHHIMPFHLKPELELDPNNFITLCMDKNECHLRIGHGDDWQSYNPFVVQDAAIFQHIPSTKRKDVEAKAKRDRIRLRS